MKVYSSIKHLQNRLNLLKSEGKTVGFVPTMGALHEGHISLVDAANKSNDVVVCCIFVNPTQFNTKVDLVKYPRTFEADKALLKKASCDIIFKPKVSGIYPKNMSKYRAPDVGNMATILEGEFRPGHFDGVMQVVERLLRIVEPDALYMGLKDYQQFAIVSQMVKVLGIKVQMRGMPIVREETGLARSSRNVRLSNKARTNAKIIYNALSKVKSALMEYDIPQLELLGKEFIARDKTFELEYFVIVDQQTLLPPSDPKTKDNLIVLAAAWVEGVRLIDNMLLD